ncbi:MAG TPA: stage III sporulation protein AF [Mobilitalea sp.]|nr:stage III sporulation protein AF [Mobilitalea sp.]
MDILYEWIRNIVIYMILNTIIMNLLGNSSYKKYVSIVSGMILVLIVISPLMKYMELEENLDYYLQSNEFAVETSDFKNSLQHMEKEQLRAVFDEYGNKVKEQVRELLLVESLIMTDFKLMFDLDSTSKSFGEMTSMKLVASYQEVEDINKEDKNSKRIDIKEIDIAEVSSISKDKQEIPIIPPSPAEINIKIKLSDFYNIDMDNINITIRGG